MPKLLLISCLLIAVACRPASPADFPCRASSDCPAGWSCGETAFCVVGVSQSNPCAAGQTSCAGECVDVQTDLSNCGNCGVKCAPPQATGVCQGGSCDIASCNAGYGDCDHEAANGCEANLETDNSNCGGCGMPCAPANATGVCSGGSCGIQTCDSPYMNCNATAADGCETDVGSDVNNCGMCGHACDLPNATAACTLGSCTIASCDPGWENCDQNPSNGCEMSTAMGGCGGTCSPGFMTCGDSDGGTCQTDVNFDPNNCGGCGVKCQAAYATTGCDAGTCFIASCAPDHADCDKIYSDGCEVYTSTDIDNCGMCGMACEGPNSTQTCDDGQCEIEVCSAGYQNCTGVTSDGCEADTNTDVNNCGSCGHVCSYANGSASCNQGSCSLASCNSGYMECTPSGSSQASCVSQTDQKNCGTCGNSCGSLSCVVVKVTAGGRVDSVACCSNDPGNISADSCVYGLNTCTESEPNLNCCNCW